MYILSAGHSTDLCATSIWAGAGARTSVYLGGGWGADLCVMYLGGGWGADLCVTSLWGADLCVTSLSLYSLYRTPRGRRDIGL